MMPANFARFGPRLLWRMAFATACLGVWLISTGASRGYFVLTFDETADTWSQGVVPTALEVPALRGIELAHTPLFSRQAIGMRDVHQLKVNQVGLVMVQPASLPSFAFLHSCRIVATADNLPEVTIADGNNFAGETNFIGLNVADVDLQAYARQPNFVLRGLVEAADAPERDVVLRLVVNLESYVTQPGAACWQ